MSNHPLSLFQTDHPLSDPVSSSSAWDNDDGPLLPPLSPLWDERTRYPQTQIPSWDGSDSSTSTITSFSAHSAHSSTPAVHALDSAACSSPTFPPLFFTASSPTSMTSSLTPARTSAAERVWGSPELRQRIYTLVDIDKLLIFQYLSRTGWEEASVRAWRQIDLYDYQKLERCLTSREHRRFYTNLARELYLDHCLPLAFHYEGLPHLFHIFPNLVKITGQWYTLEWPNRPSRNTSIKTVNPRVILTLHRRMELPALDVSPRDLDFVKRFPPHWEVKLRFNLDLVDRKCENPEWCAPKHEKSKLADGIRNLRGDLAVTIGKLGVDAGLSLRTIAYYHRERLRRGLLPTTGYDLVILSYTLDDLTFFATATKGTVSELILQPHPSVDPGLTLYDLLSRFDWKLFIGIKRVDIMVNLQRHRSTGKTVRSFRDPPRPSFNRIYRGPCLDLHSLTIRINHPRLPNSLDKLYYTPRDVAQACLPIGGMGCDYGVEFCSESDVVEGMSAMMTRMVRLEMERV